jgi:hypothetical protein
MKVYPAINWAEVPSTADERPMLKIIHAPIDGIADFIILSPHLVGVWTHWIDGRTQPCIKGIGCLCEAEELPTRWKGYLAAMAQGHDRPVLVELTANAARLLPACELEAPHGGIRGRFLRLSRASRRKTGPIEATLGPSAPEGKLLPPCPNVQAELQRIWTSGR